MMKFAFTLKNKLKIAVLLFAIMCCTLLIRFLEDKSIKKINQSFISMYNDRLIPATDLYFIGENLYQKNDVLQNALIFNAQNLSLNLVSDQLNKLNKNIDSVITKYELTLLVKQEAVFLSDLKTVLSHQRKIENDILSITATDVQKARIVYEASGRNAAAETINKLSALIKIQSKVGDELLKDSAPVVSGTNIYSIFQVILAVLIGVLIVAIVAASNAVRVEYDKFNLN